MTTNEQILKDFEKYLQSQDTLCEDNINILTIMPALLQLQNTKGNIYGRSWCKHEDMSAFFNLERKFDRISNIMEKAMKNGTEETLFGKDSPASTPTETFVDTVVDLGLYSLMWVGLIMERHPEQYQKFLEANKLNP